MFFIDINKKWKHILLNLICIINTIFTQFTLTFSGSLIQRKTINLIAKTEVTIRIRT